MPGIGRIKELSEVAKEGNIPVDIPAHVSDGCIAQICRINTLREKREETEEILVLRVVVQAEHGFHFAAANAQPGLETIVGDGPIERRVVLSELPEVSVINLCANAKSVGHLCGGVQGHFGEGGAALA